MNSTQKLRIEFSTDYYPFGQPMPERNFNEVDYKFGFNGKENDNQVSSSGSWQNYGMREYDTRIARFISVDPLTAKYPWYTPYQFAGNKPISCSDLDGEEEFNRTDYLDATGNLYKTEIKMTTSYKAAEGIQTVHHSMATANPSTGDFSIQYLGSTSGTTRGVNAFMSPNTSITWNEGALADQLRQTTLKVDNNGAPTITWHSPISMDVRSISTGAISSTLVHGSYLTPGGDGNILTTGYTQNAVDVNGNNIGVRVDRLPYTVSDESSQRYRVYIKDYNAVNLTFDASNSPSYTGSTPTFDCSGLNATPQWTKDRTPQIGTENTTKEKEGCE